MPKPKILLAIDIRTHFHPAAGYPHWLNSKAYWLKFYRQQINRIKQAGFDVEVACLLKPTSDFSHQAKILAEFKGLFAGNCLATGLTCESRRDNADFIRRFARARGVVDPAKIILFDQWPAELARAKHQSIKTVSASCFHPYEYSERGGGRTVIASSATARTDKIRTDKIRQQHFILTSLVSAENGGDIFTEPHFDIRLSNLRSDKKYVAKSLTRIKLDFMLTTMEAIKPDLFRTNQALLGFARGELYKSDSDLTRVHKNLCLVAEKYQFLAKSHDDIEEMIARLYEQDRKSGRDTKYLSKAVAMLDELNKHMADLRYNYLDTSINYHLKKIAEYAGVTAITPEKTAEVIRLAELADDDFLAEFSKDKEADFKRVITTNNTNLQSAKLLCKQSVDDYYQLCHQEGVSRVRLRDVEAKLIDLSKLIIEKEAAVASFKTQFEGLQHKQQRILSEKACETVCTAIQHIDWSVKVSGFGSYSKNNSTSYPRGIIDILEALAAREDNLDSIIDAARLSIERGQQGYAYALFGGFRNPITQNFYELIASLKVNGEVQADKVARLADFVERHKTDVAEDKILHLRSAHSFVSTLTDSDSDSEDGRASISSLLSVSDVDDGGVDSRSLLKAR